MIGKNRALFDVILSRIEEKDPLIQVVLGPRQVGKTTAVKAAIKGKGVYRSADSPVPLANEHIEKWWDEALALKEKILVIDEIQKIVNWSEQIKYLWDNKQKVKLVITGSSALLVDKGLRETLAGRFELIRAEHWNFSEANKIFDVSIKKFIEFGCYPGSQRFSEDIVRWSEFIRDSIVEPAIGRDLLQLHPIEQPALLRQVFGVASSLPAQILSLSKLQGQLQHKGSAPTIQSYLRLLSQAFLITGVQKYSASSFRTKSSFPKLIIHDNALIRAFEKPVTSPLSPEKFGRYFENAVGSRFIEAGWDTYYWKDRNYEVDFVVVSPENKKYAIEVKSQKTDKGELKGIFKFCELFPDFQPCLISLVSQKIEGIESLDPTEILSLSRKGSRSVPSL